MTVPLIELLVGLYFVGEGVTLETEGNIRARLRVTLFKLLFGIILLVLAYLQGVRFI